jgi:putative hydrolase of HD superfamily
MDIETTVDTLLHGIQLKQTARTGWGQRGVPDAESVADHSFGVAFAVVVLAPQLDQPLDLAKALAMAVLHDLPEALTSDIPSPAWRLMPEGVKRHTEERAMRLIAGGVDGGEALLALWQELKEGRTIEARLVNDADKIDLYLQALVYEQQSGNRRLGEFWQKPAEFHLSQAQALVEALQERRP